MRVEIPFVVLNKKGRPVEGADVSVFKRADYDAGGNVYGLSSASASSVTYTYVTDYPHNLAVGNLITVTGSSIPAYNVTGAAITAIPTTSSFSLVGGTSGPDIPVISGGTAVKVPLSQSLIYLYSNPTNITPITSLKTDAYGRIEGWLDEGQYVIRISGLNLDATQYFEAVAGNVDSGTFTRAGVTLGNDSIKFGENVVITATANDSGGTELTVSGNTETNGYSSSFTAFPYIAGSGTRVLAAQSSLAGFPTSGIITVRPDQTLSITSATRALNSSVSPNTYDYTFTASAAHSLTVGSRVIISGAVNLSYNGEFTISSVTSTTFTVGGPEIDPGSNSGFASGEAQCQDQSYEVTYSALASSQTITGGSITSPAFNQVTGLTTATAPIVGQGVSVVSGGSTLVEQNTAVITAVSGSNPYMITMSQSATGAASGNATVSLSYGVVFAAATGVYSVGNNGLGGLTLTTLPSYVGSYTNAASGFGIKNGSLSATMTATNANVDALRVTLNSLIQDLKKYGIIS